MFEKVETYPQDYELFNSLGLKKFSVNIREDYLVGNVKLPHYEKANVSIYVRGYPSQFWKFEIETDEGDKYVIKTGSGGLYTYWNSVLLVAEGMFVVDKN